jgi:amidase
MEALQAVLGRIETALGKAEPVNAADRPMADLYWAFRYVQGWEAWRSDGEMIERYGLRLGPDVAARFAFSKRVTAAQYAAAGEVRAVFTRHLGTLLGHDGVLLLPTMPDIPPLSGTDGEALEDYRNRAVEMLCLAGLSGFPQLSLPLATRDGAPLGLSLLGAAGSDRSLIAFARTLVGAIG